MGVRGLWLWLLVLAAGCGSTGSADAFKGDWHGILSWTPDGEQTRYYSASIHVQTSGDTLELAGLCSADHGPTGKVDGASTFVLDHAACDPAPASCGMVTFTTESGAGTMSGATLSFGLTAALRGCGSSLHITAGVTGTRGPAPDGGTATDDGGTSSNAAPVASIRAPTTVGPGTLVTLDGTQSYDPEGQPLAYQWTLVAPLGSAATLQGAAAAQATFTADVTGTFTAQLTVSDGQKTASSSATIVVASGSMTLLGFAPVDAEYDRPLDRVVAVSTAPDQVHLLDPTTLDDRTASLPLVPRAVSVSADGLQAVVGHDAWISTVDLGTMTVLHTWPITADVGDVVVTDPITVDTRTTRFAYIFPSRDQWTAIHVVDVGNGAETTVGGLVYSGMRARLQPGAFELFAIDPALSPTQLYRWSIDAGTGSLSAAGESPYWGDYPIGDNLWISDDGMQILTAAGTRFRSADMTYGGKTSVSRISWADASSASGRWVVQPGVSSWDSNTAKDDTVYWTYDTVYLANPQRVDYPRYLRAGDSFDLHGRYVFWNQAGTGIVVLAEVDTAAQLTTGWTVLRY